MDKYAGRVSNMISNRLTAGSLRETLRDRGVSGVGDDAYVEPRARGEVPFLVWSCIECRPVHCAERRSSGPEGSESSSLSGNSVEELGWFPLSGSDCFEGLNRRVVDRAGVTDVENGFHEGGICAGASSLRGGAFARERRGQRRRSADHAVVRLLSGIVLVTRRL